MLIYSAASLYIIIYSAAMLCARVRVIGRACDPMGPRARARGIGAARACGGVRAYINARGHASGREGAQGGGVVSHGRSQRRLDGPGRGLSLAAGAIPPPWPLRASQGLSGALSSEQGRAVPYGRLWARVDQCGRLRRALPAVLAPCMKKPPTPCERAGGRGREGVSLSGPVWAHN